MEACTLCREKYPGDGDRCEENRKPVPDEPGEAAKVTGATRLSTMISPLHTPAPDSDMCPTTVHIP